MVSEQNNWIRSRKLIKISSFDIKLNNQREPAFLWPRKYQIACMQLNRVILLITNVELSTLSTDVRINPPGCCYATESESEEDIYNGSFEYILPIRAKTNNSRRWFIGPLERIRSIVNNAPRSRQMSACVWPPACPREWRLLSLEEGWMDLEINGWNNNEL